MLLRDAWKPRCVDDVLGLIQNHPLAYLVSNDASGLQASNCPMIFHHDRGSQGVLVGHMARANSQWRGFEQSPRVLAIFSGPNGYVSPAWYPNRDMAPTWYQSTVQVSGRVRVNHDPQVLRSALEHLVGVMEGGRADAWSMRELDESGIERRLRAIVGLEIEVETILANFKLGQDEPPADVKAVCRHFQSTQPELAALVELHNARVGPTGQGADWRQTVDDVRDAPGCWGQRIPSHEATRR